MDNLDNNLNDEVEPFKQIAYAFKDLAQEQKNVSIKILRALRNHEKRLVRIENQLNLTPSKKELADYQKTVEVDG